MVSLDLLTPKDFCFKFHVEDLHSKFHLERQAYLLYFMIVIVYFLVSKASSLLSLVFFQISLRILPYVSNFAGHLPACKKTPKKDESLDEKSQSGPIVRPFGYLMIIDRILSAVSYFFGPRSSPKTENCQQSTTDHNQSIQPRRQTFRTASRETLCF